MSKKKQIASLRARGSKRDRWALAQSGQRPEAERAARQAKALGHAAAPALLQSLTGAPPR